MRYPFGRKVPVRTLFASLALFVLTFAVSCGGASDEQRAESPAGDAQSAAADLEHPSLGSEGTPVVLTEYADYQ